MIQKKTSWLAQPYRSMLLGIAWLLLQKSVAVLDVLAGILIGLTVPYVLQGFLAASHRRHLKGALGLVWVVLWDIAISNITVARLVLGPLPRLHPAWVRVPLALTDPSAISLLACIITTTPGTVSCTIDESRREILVHALDCRDPAQMAADIKARYEVPLLIIFQAPGQTPYSIGESP